MSASPGAPALAEGARNLLINCAGLEAGESLLIVREDPALGWYDRAAPEAVAQEARARGVTPTLLDVGPPRNAPEPGVAEAIAAHDCTVFFARIGDQDRFAAPLPGTRTVMCYARDAAMLASAYGRASHLAFRDLKDAVNAVLLGAGRIEITCPRGTAYAGTVSEADRAAPADVSVLRFPLGVPQPLDGAGFSGRVAVARYLTPTGSRVYEPPALALEGTIQAEVEAGRIAGFTGERDEVARVRAHYERVAGEFGIDWDVVHSWHAGIHPASAYGADVAEDPDRWSNSVFTNPRFVHFHTCGDYAPGEICWNVLDPSIAIDGVALWDKGRLRPAAFPRTKACLETWPELAALFAAPSDAIGLPLEA